MKNICNLICDLVEYAVSHALIEECDRVYATNRILERLGVDDYAPDAHTQITDLEEILGGICDYAAEQGLCEDSIVYRDLFDTAVMGTISLGSFFPVSPIAFSFCVLNLKCKC